MEDYIVNSNLIIGICYDSNNEEDIPEIIDCKNSKQIDNSILLDCGSSKDEINYEIIDGNNSDISKREQIEVQYIGETDANIDGQCTIGDRLCMSPIPGKVQSMEYLNNEYIPLRKIGKVISILSKDKVRVLLDIE